MKAVWVGDNAELWITEASELEALKARVEGLEAALAMVTAALEKVAGEREENE